MFSNTLVSALNIFCSIVILNLFHHADAATITSEKLDKLDKLSSSPTWLKLLHFTPQGKSAVTNPEFFLAADGSTNAHAELKATYLGLLEGSKIKGLPIQCRFPGRYRWLRQQLQWTEQEVSSLACPEFESFSLHGQAQSLSLVFATGFLGNPASYYGHLLLKVNDRQRRKNSSDLTATAVNFGADVPVDENMALYIIKGVIGHYPSSFSHLQYFYHSHNYGETELRDLWEFELDLPSHELEFILGHLWEVMTADFDYYFFNRNCAYRIGEVLELVTDNRLTNHWRGWETPQAVVQRVSEATHNQKPLVNQVRFYPSRQSRLYQRFERLTAIQREKLKLLVAQPTKMHSLLAPLSPEEQYPILDTLLDYYQILRDTKEGEADINNAYYNQVLSQRYQLPPGGIQPTYHSDNRPDQGRKPSYLNIGLFSDLEGSNTLNLWLRPAYYDALDASFGHTRHAALSMGELQLGIIKDKVYFRDLSLVKIESVRPNLTGLPGDQHHSWYLDVGARQQHLKCTECLAIKTRAGIGYAKSDVTEQFMAALYGGVGYLSQNLQSKDIYLSTTASLNWYASERLSLRAEGEQRWSDDSNSWLYRLDARWVIATNFDLRLSLQKDVFSQFSISSGWYW